ncbi:GTP-binding protein 2-like isoform X1 [Coregonus clupeaformis]|uniref:GTP-binding protein 2-like isoform X1 n=1 Tax=Coregonus clupeaformis TaxID=59861 RepID=UPI001E1C4792|nr:GTP-binding protein 2-like isoform X1 [Coregonus clupeaformis]
MDARMSGGTGVVGTTANVRSNLPNVRSNLQGPSSGNGRRMTSKKTRSKKGKRRKRRRSKKTKTNRTPPYLPPEAEEGNIEYKLKLVNPTQYRFEHLATQLKWRLQEGRGEAVYQIGVEDNGLLVGLSEGDMRASLKTLRRMAEKVGADITLLREREVDYDSDRSCRKIAEVLVRKVPDDQQFLDLRVAVLGNVDSGKSTLLGVLTQGELDNGRGRARLNLFRHLHEIQTGRTSSISFEILGFNSKGEVVNYSDSRTAEEICESSSKMITFIDLAGHHKYLKTTIFGLTSYCPDFAMLVVSANTGIAGTTREHLGLAMALKVPIFIVVSKVDLCAKGTVERTVRQLEYVLKLPGCNKVPMVVASPDDAVTAAQQFAQSSSITPIFTLSSVSGESLDLLKVFFNILPPLSNSKEQEELMQQLTEFQVDEIYTVPDVGTVVGGTLYSGVCREGERLVVGPTDEGRFLRLKVGSIHRNRSACRVLRAGQAATLALGNFDRSLLRKGMVMVSTKMNPTICWQFEAAIVLLFHAKTFRRGFQVTVHVGNVRQTATVECLHGKEELRTGERAVVCFRFIKHPEYLRMGAKLLFREGVTKGIGHVTSLLPNSHNHDQNHIHDQNQREVEK